jgi:flavodoxin
MKPNNFITHDKTIKTPKYTFRDKVFIIQPTYQEPLEHPPLLSTLIGWVHSIITIETDRTDKKQFQYSVVFGNGDEFLVDERDLYSAASNSLDQEIKKAEIVAYKKIKLYLNNEHKNHENSAKSIKNIIKEIKNFYETNN